MITTKVYFYIYFIFHIIVSIFLIKCVQYLKCFIVYFNRYVRTKIRLSVAHTASARHRVEPDSGSLILCSGHAATAPVTRHAGFQTRALSHSSSLFIGIGFVVFNATPIWVKVWVKVWVRFR